jgi:hypothetical protein
VPHQRAARAEVLLGRFQPLMQVKRMVCVSGAALSFLSLLEFLHGESRVCHMNEQPKFCDSAGRREVWSFCNMHDVLAFMSASGPQPAGMNTSTTLSQLEMIDLMNLKLHISA